ncbi:SCO family protein [Actimicrobium sp. CCI2.3]|uniref:SCO family protein n=1 Tax=Actimicrobium sp. CCI2.3 TaxID=3048616 RepID=UPI002AB44F86|nr:SCO family protein [Actimicrobium sp. CCI2.3]MDY7573114.1 SCO family protein [Actimicrobium sp. CCI2.3]MEB0020345.1 SCO family protein [Actimicrobium sp. CCI2.3]
MVQNSSRRPETPTAGLLQTFAASLLALLLGLAVIVLATDGGHAFTTEALRRGQVARTPQRLPDFRLRDRADQPAMLRQLLARDGRVQIVDFVYTRCQTVCSVLGSVYQRLQQQLLERGLQDQVGLLTISFDPANDNAAALQDYAARLRMDPVAWQIVTLANVADRRRLLDAFGIMVVPAPLGEFEHNAALHIIAADGRLVRIVDYEAINQVIDIALATSR